MAYYQRKEALQDDETQQLQDIQQETILKNDNFMETNVNQLIESSSKVNSLTTELLLSKKDNELLKKENENLTKSIDHVTTEKNKALEAIAKLEADKDKIIEDLETKLDQVKQESDIIKKDAENVRINNEGLRKQTIEAKLRFIVSKATDKSVDYEAVKAVIPELEYSQKDQIQFDSFKMVREAGQPKFKIIVNY